MRRRSAVSIVAACMVFVLSGAAGAANSESYPDPVGDAAGGFADITNLAVSNDDSGGLVVTTSIAGGLPLDAELDIFLYAARVYRIRYTVSGAVLLRWEGTYWLGLNERVYSTFRLDGVRIEFERSSIGSPDSVEVQAKTYHPAPDRTEADATALHRFDIVVGGPQTTITSGPATTTTATSASFTYTSSRPSSTFQCSFDNAAFTACSASGAAYQGLAPGTHGFRVRARDTYGNFDPTPASRIWTVQGSGGGGGGTRQDFVGTGTRIRPSPPRAGERVGVLTRFVYRSSGRPVRGGRLSCLGTLGSRQILGRAVRDGGRHACFFSLPRSAAGKVFTGRVTMTLAGTRRSVLRSAKVVRAG